MKFLASETVVSVLQWFERKKVPINVGVVVIVLLFRCCGAGCHAAWDRLGWGELASTCMVQYRSELSNLIKLTEPLLKLCAMEVGGSGT
ncbi:hypothetical protein SADUNF_Sadunf19G0027400 [Salix dunnii]|uniref:Uncharacterized protein n=1 Tax=Salix dunnii TaxID=1413687 RepID=A0A835J0C9_9ROSI|nr:hypothetical protein SADUNF_Sadunf19G0005200 [Salix dunnii]KAF9661048.1 hypothetical protein SADUNF_Sadunf19G0027400 [Salix dunnii]